MKKNKYFIGSDDQRITLEETNLEKVLGVYIDPNLDFKKHIKNTVKETLPSKNLTFLYLCLKL